MDKSNNKAAGPTITSFAKRILEEWCAKHQWAKELIGHVFAAVFIASLVVILHYCHLLSGLDALFLRFASTSVTLINPTPQKVSSPDYPLVVLGIGDRYYENEFNQASPLSRRELQKIISRIAESGPRVIAIDFDLSPGPCAEPENKGSDCDFKDYTVEESELYNYLLTEKPPAVRIVLQLPFPVDDEKLKNRKLEWMKSLCEKGIEFGRISIDSEFGMATKIRRGSDRLSCSVYRLQQECTSISDPDNIPDRDKICGTVGDQNAKNGSNKSQNGEPVTSSPVPICQRFKNHTANDKQSGFPEAKQLLVPLIEEPPGIESPAPINFVFVRNSTLHEVMKLEDIPKNLAGDVVFLGGVYGDSDRFNTPVGKIPGVMLLAGDYYSLLHPIEKTHEIAVYIIEIVFGIFLGFAFARGWKGYFRKYPVFQGGHDANVIVSTACYLGAIVVSLPVIMPIFGIFAIFSAILMAGGWWFNPAPMVLGMAGEGFVTSLEAAGEKHESHSEKKSVDWASWVLFAGILIVVITVIVSALVFVFVLEH